MRNTTTDGRKTEEHSDNMSAIKKVAYSENKSGIRTTNDEQSIGVGGCTIFRAHNYAYSPKNITCKGMVLGVAHGENGKLFMAVLFIGGKKYQTVLSSEEFDVYCELVEPQTSIVGDTDWSTKEESDLKEQFDMLSADHDPPFELEGHEYIQKTFSYTGLHPDRPWGTFDMLENKPESIKIDTGKKKEKVQTGIYFVGIEGYRHFGKEVLGITEPKKNGTRGGVQRYKSVETLVNSRMVRDFGVDGASGLGLGFTRHPDTPYLTSKNAIDERALFYLKNFGYEYCPGFFQDMRTLCGYLSSKNITTVEEFRTWQGNKFPVLEKAYLHELNCRYDREHRENPMSKKSNYIESLDGLPLTRRTISSCLLRRCNER